MKIDTEIIGKYIAGVDPHMPLLEMSKCEVTVFKTAGTGKYHIVKSKWKIVNWWRKLIGMEKLKEEIAYQWVAPGYHKTEE